MRQIALVVLAISLLVLPSPLLAENHADGSSSTPTARPCGPGKLATSDSMYAQLPPQHTGECICPPMPGAAQSGCGGHDETGCSLDTCHYIRYDYEEGTITEEGDVSCTWQPYGFAP